MTTITYTEFQANMHFYLDRVFRDKAIIKVKDGQRTFVLLGESLPTPISDNISQINQLKVNSTRKSPSSNSFRRMPRSAYFFR